MTLFGQAFYGPKKRKIFFLIFWIWLLFIVYNSVSPQNPSPIDNDNSIFFIRPDYLLHFLAYLILIVFYGLWRSKNILSLPRNILWIGLAAGLSMAFLTEIIQLSIPGRSFNPYDILANSLGILFGVTLIISSSQGKVERR